MQNYKIQLKKREKMLKVFVIKTFLIITNKVGESVKNQLREDLGLMQVFSACQQNQKTTKKRPPDGGLFYFLIDNFLISCHPCLNQSLRGILPALLLKAQ